MNKRDIANKLKDAIAWYTDITVEEHLTSILNTDADEAWADIEKYIKQLVES